MLLKKFTAAMLSVLILSLTAFGEAETDAPKETDVQPVQNIWVESDVTDDFGDPTGEKQLENYTEGTFSNAEETDALLRTYTVYYPEYYRFAFRFLEDEEKKVVCDDGVTPKLNIKIGDIVYDYTLTTENYDGNFYLSYDREPDGYLMIFNSLLEGADVRCVVYVNDAKYRFDVPAESFSVVTEVFNQNSYEQAEKAYSERQYRMAEMLFTLLGNYEDSPEKASAARDDAVMKEQYDKATDLFNQEDYSGAVKIFKSLENYENSPVMVEKCNEKLEDARKNNETFMVFNTNGELVYDAKVRNGKEVVDSQGNIIDGCTVDEDGYVIDAYWNKIDPKTGTIVD